jgi:hypothetical protein
MGAKQVHSEWKNGALAFTTTAKNIETLTLIPKKTGCGNADLIRSMWTPSPEIATVYFNDFAPCKNTSTTAYPGFTVTTATAGVVVAQDEVGGVLGLVGGGGEHSKIEMQSRAGFVTIASGKDLWFEARVKFTDTDQSKAFIGLSAANTLLTKTIPTLGKGEMIGFYLNDGASKLFFVCSSGTATPVALANKIQDDTYYRLAFYFDSNSHAHAYIDDAEVTIPVTVSSALAEIPKNALRVSLAHKTGEATANKMHVDYVKVIQLR